MEYSDVVTALGALLVVPIVNSSSPSPSSNTDFNNILPWIINSAEQRMYRDFDFLATRTTANITVSTTSRQNTLPSQIIVLQSANVITPPQAQPKDGTRVPLQIVSKDFIDSAWPQELTSQQTPEYIAQLNETQIILAPTPENPYELECTGIFRPLPLSYTNTITYLTSVYPDSFLYACMIFATGYQRDFGAQSDDPAMAMSWQRMYDGTKQSVMDEEQRRKTQSTNWSPYSPAPLSNPQRR